MRRLVSAGTALVTMLTVLVATSSPAHADSVTRSYSTVGLKAKLTLTFERDGDMRIQGWVKDVCPGDAQRVYVADRMEAIKKARGGGWRVVDSRGVLSYWQDDNGCGNGRTRIDNTAIDFPAARAQMIRIKVCRENPDDDDDSPLCVVQVFPIRR